MTDDLRFQRLARDWLELGPVEAPDDTVQAALFEIDTTPQERDFRVPWRFPTMYRIALVAAVTLAALIGIGVFFAGSKPAPSPSLSVPTSTTPSGAPTAPPSEAASSAASLVLDKAFISPRNGYRVSYPKEWEVDPASADWAPGTVTNWGDPALDTLTGTTGRVVAASQPLAPGETAAQWITAYCQGGGQASGCADAMSAWRQVKAGEDIFYVDLDGAAAAPNAIVPDAVIFDAVAVNDGRGYELTLDGKVDRPTFDRLLASVRLMPEQAVAVSNLTKPFNSRLYDYRVLIDPTWTTTTATVPIDDPSSTDENSSDNIRIPGTDTTIGIARTSMGGKPYEEWVIGHHQDAIGDVPSGCDGGDPSTWPTVRVGDQTGHVMQLCNAAEVSVPVGGDAYLLFWGNDTFTEGQHLQQAQFYRIIESMEFGRPAPSASPSR